MDPLAVSSDAVAYWSFIGAGTVRPTTTTLKPSGAIARSDAAPERAWVCHPNLVVRRRGVVSAAGQCGIAEVPAQDQVALDTHPRQKQEAVTRVSADHSLAEHLVAGEGFEPS